MHLSFSPNKHPLRLFFISLCLVLGIFFLFESEKALYGASRLYKQLHILMITLKVADVASIKNELLKTKNTFPEIESDTKYFTFLMYIPYVKNEYLDYLRIEKETSLLITTLLIFFDEQINTSNEMPANELTTNIKDSKVFQYKSIKNNKLIIQNCREITDGLHAVRFIYLSHFIPHQIAKIQKEIGNEIEICRVLTRSS